MTQDDYDAFCEVVLGFAELKGRQISGPAIELYWRAMQHWPLQEFREAAQHLLRTSEFMPTPKNFEDCRKAGEPGPSEAWVEALSGCAEWRNPERLPSGRIARAAAAVGGFRAIALADLERDIPHIQRRFLKAYEELSDVESMREALPQIAAHGARAALRGPVSLAGVVSRLQGPISQATQPVRVNPPLQLPAPTPTKQPTGAVADKIAKLIALDMSDADIAKISGAPIETVCQVRAGLESAA